MRVATFIFFCSLMAASAFGQETLPDRTGSVTQSDDSVETFLSDLENFIISLETDNTHSPANSVQVQKLWKGLQQRKENLGGLMSEEQKARLEVLEDRFAKLQKQRVSG